MAARHLREVEPMKSMIRLAAAAALATYAAANAGGQGAADSTAIVKYLAEKMTRRPS